MIIVAGGTGSRMRQGGLQAQDRPKQFMDLGGKPVIMRTIERFKEALPALEVILVINKEYIVLWRNLRKEYGFTIPCKTVVGGTERFFSVRNGLYFIPDDMGDCVVGVHDAVRPLVSVEVIRRAYAEAEESDAVVPVMPSTQSVRITDEDGASHVINRRRVMIVQTPQVFRLSVLKQAYRQPYSDLFTDDASVVEHAGHRITLVEGNRENIKLTTPADFLFAQALIKEAESGQCGRTPQNPQAKDEIF